MPDPEKGMWSDLYQLSLPPVAVVAPGIQPAISIPLGSQPAFTVRPGDQPATTVRGSDFRLFARYVELNLKIARSERKPVLARLPRFWELFGYVLTPGIRRRVYEPALQDLIEDYLNALTSSECDPRSLTVVFTIRTAFLVTGRMHSSILILGLLGDAGTR